MGSSDLPLLLTPGPLSTAESTRRAMLVDRGSRDPSFSEITAEVRRRLVTIAGGGDEFTAIPVQGSGTFAVEAAIGTFVPRDGRVLVLSNGAYGRRMVSICQRLERRWIEVPRPETSPVDLGGLDAALARSEAISHVAVVHCETTTGLLNPVEEVAAITQRHGRSLIVDAMSAFGAVPLGLDTVDCVVASSNTALEGVPGVGFAIARKASIAACASNAPSLVLDLHAQWERFEADGQWRFTPPTHVMSALRQALRDHDAEGGVAGRGARYRANRRALVDGLRALGFETLLPDSVQAPIIVTFHLPDGMGFHGLYSALLEEGFAIYPGKLTQKPTFRVGCIGQVYPADIERFVAAVSRIRR